ncbi:MAG: S8 family serine peptidase [Phycisphaerales bacterium]|nr:S8 family serine peptidase [Phycisphaerales bacterium]
MRTKTRDRSGWRCRGWSPPVFISASLAAAACSLGAGLTPNDGAAPFDGMVGANDGQPCPYPCKPAKSVLEPYHDRSVIAVKFNDGLIVRLREGELSDLGTGALKDALDLLKQLEGAGARWQREHHVDEAVLSRLCAGAARNLGRPTPDLNLEFRLRLPAHGTVTPEQAIDSLNALVCVEMAGPIQLPAPLPLPPSFRADQEYIDGATDGMGASLMWGWPGGTGAGLRVADIEYSWNLSHLDLPTVTRLGPFPIDPFDNNNHGTAVLGMMLALDNGWGVSGGTHGATGHVVGANTSGGYSVGAAITVALATLDPGDVILIEQQAFGPGNVLIPSEWVRTAYNAIVTAVGNGVIVVEAAGNGGANLDSTTFSQGNNGHWPFLPANDSGAFIIGAGAAPPSAGGSSVDRSRLSFSCYGSTVDFQGWGQRIRTLGYGSLYNLEGVDLLYEVNFGGTSGASPIVAAACLALQGVYKEATDVVLSPAELKAALLATGSPQLDGQFPATQQIGPRPDAYAAAWEVFGDADCNSNGVPDAVDIAQGLLEDLNGNLIADLCECPVDYSGNGVPDSADITVFLSLWFADIGGGSLHADFNGSGATNSADITAFLAAWFVALAEGC